jgi:hypothetical protein
VATPHERPTDQSGEPEFLTISFWDLLESVRGFAGDEIDSAGFYPDDGHFLVDRETVVRRSTVQ